MSKPSAARKRQELPGELPAAGSAVSMRKQAHGGALRSGGPNGGAGGRPPSVLRSLAREALGDALPGLRLVAMGEPVKVTRVVNGVTMDADVRPAIGERLEAVDRLKDLGLGDELRSEEVRKRMEAVVQILAELLPPDLYAAVMARVEEAWA